MAKISAYGEHKVAEGYIDVRSSYDGERVRYWVVITSGRRALLAVSRPDADTSYDRKRGGYTLLGKVSEKVNLDTEGSKPVMEMLRRRYERRGMEVLDVKHDGVTV